MATKINLEHQFTGSVDRVWTMYSDRAFFERKYKDSGATNIEVVDCKKTDKNFSITVRYDTRSDAPVPDFAKKFMSERISVTQTDSWDATTRTGKLVLEIKGMPIKVHADMKLEAAGTGAVNRMQWTLSSSIPLIGGKLESLLGEDVKVKSARDQVVSAKILESY